MGHYIYAFLHELKERPTTSEDDRAAYCEWSAQTVEERFGMRLSIWDPLLVVPTEPPVIEFPQADRHGVPLLGYLRRHMPQADHPWQDALCASLAIVAAEMELYGAVPSLSSETNEANDRLFDTGAAALTRGICHDIPIRLVDAYRKCVGQTCEGKHSTERDRANFQRVGLATLYECFINSYFPPFARPLAPCASVRGYRCLDLRQAALSGECRQGNPESPHGEVAISFAHVKE